MNIITDASMALKEFQMASIWTTLHVRLSLTLTLDTCEYFPRFNKKNRVLNWKVTITHSHGSVQNIRWKHANTPTTNTSIQFNSINNECMNVTIGHDKASCMRRLTVIIIADAVCYRQRTSWKLKILIHDICIHVIATIPYRYVGSEILQCQISGRLGMRRINKPKICEHKNSFFFILWLLFSWYLSIFFCSGSIADWSDCIASHYI